MEHVTYIEVDGVGQYGWYCTDDECRAEATGYEDAAEVLAAAKNHGPLAADSMVPADYIKCDDCGTRWPVGTVSEESLRSHRCVARRAAGR